MHYPFGYHADRVINLGSEGMFQRGCERMDLWHYSVKENTGQQSRSSDHRERILPAFAFMGRLQTSDGSDDAIRVRVMDHVSHAGKMSSVLSDNSWCRRRACS